MSGSSNDEHSLTPTDLPDWLNDPARMFFTRSEADQVKAKLNGLSVGVDYMKVAVGGLALGFTPVKIDAALLKIDEKGIVWTGRQLWTWPHARDADKRRDRAANRQHKKVLKREQKVNSALSPFEVSPSAKRKAEAQMKKFRKERDELSKILLAMHNDASKANKAKKDAETARATVKNSYAEIIKRQSEMENQLKALDRALVG
ncbi:hypothetical protein ACFV98_25185 [Streptomyces violascens]|uniref:hypothetical protein n=1 Tax=Streptomyces violascens TaxID=67381 RepID=UPI003669EF27